MSDVSNKHFCQCINDSGCDHLPRFLFHSCYSQSLTIITQLMLEAHVATSASTDTQEIPSTCISMPSDPVLMKGFIFISNNAVLSWFLWQVYAHSHNVVNNWHSLTVTCYQATVVEHIFTKKIWHPFPHSIKHNLFVLGASCTTVLNILLCPHQERVTCLWSLVDNAQNWFLIHYVSCRWVAQLSTNNNMFQPCTPIKASMALKNSV